MPRRRANFGLTFIEVLITILVMGILAALVIPSASPTPQDQLLGVARVLATDLAYGRSLAVANNSRYALQFDTTANQYVLRHSGTNSALNSLPHTAFSRDGDPATQHIVALASLPHIGPPVSLYKILAMQSTPVTITSVEFGPLGATTQTAQTAIWLAAGSGSVKSYMPVYVNPVTGLATIGALSGACK